MRTGKRDDEAWGSGARSALTQTCCLILAPGPWLSTLGEEEEGGSLNKTQTKTEEKKGDGEKSMVSIIASHDRPGSYALTRTDAAKGKKGPACLDSPDCYSSRDHVITPCRVFITVYTRYGGRTRAICFRNSKRATASQGTWRCCSVFGADRHRCSGAVHLFFFSTGEGELGSVGEAKYSVPRACLAPNCQSRPVLPSPIFIAGAVPTRLFCFLHARHNINSSLEYLWVHVCRVCASGPTTNTRHCGFFSFSFSPLLLFPRPSIRSRPIFKDNWPR